MIQCFARSTKGSITTIFAVSSFALIGAGALAIDYAAANRFQTRLQQAADAAVLATAKELTIGNTDKTILASVAQNYLQSNAGEIADGAKIDLSLTSKNKKVTLSVSRQWSPFFAHYFSNAITPTRVKAVATIRGTGTLCYVGLAKMGKSVVLDDRARLVGRDCGVYSNSNHPKGLSVEKSARMEAKFVCSAGGIKRHETSKLLPTPIVDCPQINDPLKNRPPPTVSACTYTDMKIKDQDLALTPGTYCGGLKIDGTSYVSLASGVYVIKDGNLEITGDAKVKGTNVGFYLTGGATLKFEKHTTIDLVAPKKGSLAGILIFEDRANKPELSHKITSDNARVLLGTIYLPVGTLEIDADGPVADKSAYTAIIAYALELKEGPALFLNSDYDATDVPVPDSLIGGKVYLDR